MAFDHPYLAAGAFACFAHRGGSEKHCENTARAFAAAVAMGYRFIETDVQASADGTVVVFHDDRLDLATDRSGVVSDLSWSELKLARTRNGDPVLTLHQALEEFPETRFNIDIKTDHALQPTLHLVRKMDCIDRVCLASFSDERLRQVRRTLGPRACISAGRSQVTALKFASWGAPAGRVIAQCAQVPLRAYGIRLVTPAFLRHCRGRGIAVHVWTINDPAEMRRLIRLGVDGIMTDRPSVLKTVAKEEGVW